MSIAVNLLHLGIIAPALLYAGAVGRANGGLTNAMYSVLFVVGLVIILYHGYLAFSQDAKLSTYLGHLLIIGPLLTYIGYTHATNKTLYTAMMVLGLVAFAVHVWLICKKRS